MKMKKALENILRVKHKFILTLSDILWDSDISSENTSKFYKVKSSILYIILFWSETRSETRRERRERRRESKKNKRK